MREERLQWLDGAMSIHPFCSVRRPLLEQDSSIGILRFPKASILAFLIDPGLASAELNAPNMGGIASILADDFGEHASMGDMTSRY